MLSKDVLKANAELANLTEEQLSAVELLSRNDENLVVAKRVGEIYGGLDKDIFDTVGVEKQQSEKTYDYAKRVLGDFKTKVEALPNLEAELKEAKTAKGGDEALKKQLLDMESTLNALKSEYEQEQGRSKTLEAEYSGKLKGFKVESAFDKALAGMRFNPAFEEGVVKDIVASTKFAINNQYGIDFNESGDAILRDADGLPVPNKNQSMSPYTLEAMVKEKLSAFMDTSKAKGGGGSTKPAIKAPTGGGLDGLSIARTRVEADEAIAKSLMERGMTRGSEEYNKQYAEIFEQNGLKDLPLQ